MDDVFAGDECYRKAPVHMEMDKREEIPVPACDDRKWAVQPGLTHTDRYIHQS